MIFISNVFWITSRSGEPETQHHLGVERRDNQPQSRGEGPAGKQQQELSGTCCGMATLHSQPAKRARLSHRPSILHWPLDHATSPNLGKGALIYLVTFTSWKTDKNI